MTDGRSEGRERPYNFTSATRERKTPRVPVGSDQAAYHQQVLASVTRRDVLPCDVSETDRVHLLGLELSDADVTRVSDRCCDVTDQ